MQLNSNARQYFIRDSNCSFKFGYILKKSIGGILLNKNSGEAKQEMRKQYCTEVDEPGAPVESCDVDEITTAKEWT